MKPKVMREIRCDARDGEIYLEQPCFGADDSVIVISPDQVDSLKQWLDEAKAEIETT